MKQNINQSEGLLSKVSRLRESAEQYAKQSGKLTTTTQYQAEISPVATKPTAVQQASSPRHRNYHPHYPKFPTQAELDSLQQQAQQFFGPTPLATEPEPYEKIKTDCLQLYAAFKRNVAEYPITTVVTSACVGIVAYQLLLAATSPKNQM